MALRANGPFIALPRVRCCGYFPLGPAHDEICCFAGGARRPRRSHRDLRRDVRPVKLSCRVHRHRQRREEHKRAHQQGIILLDQNDVEEAVERGENDEECDRFGTVRERVAA